MRIAFIFFIIFYIYTFYILSKPASFTPPERKSSFFPEVPQRQETKIEEDIKEVPSQGNQEDVDIQSILESGKWEEAREFLEQKIFKEKNIQDIYIETYFSLLLTKNKIEDAKYFLKKIKEKANINIISNIEKHIEIREDIIQSQKKSYLNFLEITYPPSYSWLEDFLKKSSQEVISYLNQNLNLPLPTENILVEMYTPTQFETLYQSSLPGFFDGTAKLKLEENLTSKEPLLLSQYISLFKHEFTHAYLHPFCGNHLPLWIHEGLALFIEGRNPQNTWSELQFIRGSQFKNLPDSFFHQSFSTENAQNIEYSYSFLIIAYSLERYGASSLGEFISSLCQSEKEEDAYLKFFGTSSLEEIWKKTQDHFGKY